MTTETRQFTVYVETPQGRGNDATFETVSAAYDWLDDRMSSGLYCEGMVTNEYGNQVQRA